MPKHMAYNWIYPQMIFILNLNTDLMDDRIFDIVIETEGKKYKGWVNPSDKKSETGQPTSFHVVIEGTSFGYLSFQDCKWSANKQRPAEMVEAIGRAIEKKYKL